MQQVLKYIGNSAMLTVSPKLMKQKKIDKTTKFEHINNDAESDIISFRIIRPAKIIFPKIKGTLTLSPEIEELINDPIYPTEERSKDPRIQYLLNENLR